MPQPDRHPFAYQALRPDGSPISGSIDAADASAARTELESLQLTEVELMPAATLAPGPVERAGPGGRAMRQDDFLAFNQQLSHLAQAGLPIEQGLRLLAQEMGRGSMRQAVEAVSAAMERGQSLPEAIAANQSRFPPLYASLVDAGIRSGNLPGVLLNMGRHTTLVRRLQRALWQTFAYPAVLLLLFIIIAYVVIVQLVPAFTPFAQQALRLQSMWRAWPPTPNSPSEPTILLSVLINVGNSLAGFPAWEIGLAALAALLALVVLVRLLLRRTRFSQRLALGVPLVGPILRRGLTARWCDAVALGVASGMDLPAAIGLSDDAIAWPLLRRDGGRLRAAVEAGKPLADVPLEVLPPLVTTTIDAASERGQLAPALELLSQTYRDQAQLRIATVPAILTPILLTLIGGLLLLMMLVVLAPLLLMIRTISGGQF